MNKCVRSKGRFCRCIILTHIGSRRKTHVTRLPLPARRTYSDRFRRVGGENHGCEVHQRMGPSVSGLSGYLGAFTGEVISCHTGDGSHLPFLLPYLCEGRRRDPHRSGERRYGTGGDPVTGTLRNGWDLYVDPNTPPSLPLYYRSRTLALPRQPSSKP